MCSTFFPQYNETHKTKNAFESLKGYLSSFISFQILTYLIFLPNDVEIM